MPRTTPRTSGSSSSTVTGQRGVVAVDDVGGGVADEQHRHAGLVEHARGRIVVRREHRPTLLRQRKEKRVGRARPQLLLEHQLDDVGERLQQPCGPTRYGPDALLQERRDLALDVHHHRRRVQQHDEDEERQDDLRDQQRRQTSASAVRAHRLPRAPVGRQRAAPFPDVRLVLVPEMLQRRQHRRDGGVAERAQRLAGDVAGDARRADRGRASAPRRARCAAGSCAASRCPRGTACTCRTTRGDRSAAGSRPATPCRSCRRARRSPPTRAASRPSATRRSWPACRADPAAESAPTSRPGSPPSACGRRARRPRRLVDQLAQRDVHRRFVDARAASRGR